MEAQHEAPKSLQEIQNNSEQAPTTKLPQNIEEAASGPPKSLGSVSDVGSTPRSERKVAIFGGDNFLAKLDAKLQETQDMHGEIVRTKFETVKADIKDYFSRLSEQIQKHLVDTRDSVLGKIESIMEMEGGYVDWDKFRGELLKKKEEYEKAPDIMTQKQAFDAYFDYYNTTASKVDAINSRSYTKLDSTSNLFRFDDIVLDKFMINFQSLCRVLESDFVTGVSFVTGQLDPLKMRLDELVQIPHEGVSCNPEKIDSLDTFILAGRDGRISMYDSKSFRVIDVIQGLNEAVNCLLYIPQHNMLLAGGNEPNIIARRIEGRNLGKHLSNLDAGGSVSSLLFIEDQNLIASVGSDPNIRLHNPNSLVGVVKIPLARKGSLPKGGALYFKDKKLLGLGFDDGTLQFYNMKTKQLAFGLFTESKGYLGMVYNEVSAQLFAHTRPGIVKIWKFKGDRPVDEEDVTIEGEGDKACNIQMVGKYLISASSNEKLLVYDVDERKVVKKVDVPGFKVQGVLVIGKEGKIVVTDEGSAKVGVIRIH